jgi:hypothetical protein
MIDTTTVSDSTVTKTLLHGLPVKDGGEPLRRVVFGKRLTAGDSIKIEDDPQSSSELQRQLMYARASIVEFGDKKRRPFLSELLTLKRADREIIVEGYVDFLDLSIGDRRQEKVDDDTIKLAFGLAEGGETFDLITLCDNSSQLSGYEELEIDRQVNGDFEHACVLIGRDVARLSQSDGGATIEGPLTIEQISRLDFFDLAFMRAAASERRLLFRHLREGVQADAGAGGSAAGPEVRVD